MRSIVGARSDGVGAGLPRQLPGLIPKTLLTPDSESIPQELPVVGLARNPAGLGAGLGDGALRREDAEHLHRLEAEPELLAAVGGADVEPRQLLHPLEPVANGVAGGGESLLGGSGPSPRGAGRLVGS